MRGAKEGGDGKQKGEEGVDSCVDPQSDSQRVGEHGGCAMRGMPARVVTRTPERPCSFHTAGTV